jgi:cytochrome bd ubiquinol oxidase subunit I
VVTGLVQEFEFGMNWSAYSRFVGDVFGAPLAIEGLAAFALESTFLGLWIFGWDRLPKGVHLATIWLAAAGTWLSAYFILVANSFMQHPVGYKLVHGKAELTSVQSLLTNKFAFWAFGHTILAGITVAATVVLGVSAWHLRRQSHAELFRRSAGLALIVLVPVSCFNLWFGSHFGIITTEVQPMKIAAAEGLWNSADPASFSLFQLGGLTQSDQTPRFSIDVPGLLSFLSTGSFHGNVQGLNQLQKQDEQKYGKGNYIPDVRATYWSMRGMAYAGSFVALMAVLAALLWWRGRFESTRWFLRALVWTMPFPYIAVLSGWVLTEMGRQPWIVQGLLKTVDASSANVSVPMLWLSLLTFVGLYVALGVVDFVLMRRYARLDPPNPDAGDPTAQPIPLVSY